MCKEQSHKKLFGQTLLCKIEGLAPIVRVDKNSRFNTHMHIIIHRDHRIQKCTVLPRKVIRFRQRQYRTAKHRLGEHVHQILASMDALRLPNH
jgi:hypothetical protein